MDESKTELPSGHMRSYEEEPKTEFPEKHCPKNNGNLSINTKLVKIGKDATIIGSGLLHNKCTYSTFLGQWSSRLGYRRISLKKQNVTTVGTHLAAEMNAKDKITN